MEIALPWLERFGPQAFGAYLGSGTCRCECACSGSELVLRELLERCRGCPGRLADFAAGGLVGFLVAVVIVLWTLTQHGGGRARLDETAARRAIAERGAGVRVLQRG